MKSSGTPAAVFIISTLMLALQLLQTRIFSVIYWSHLVYFIITMALLGLAAGGTVLSLSTRIRAIDERSLYGWCLSGFSFSALLGMYLITKLPNDFFHFWEHSGNGISLVLSYLLAMPPFFFFGLMIASVFLRNPQKAGMIYFFNLLGSAMGCLLYIFLIEPLGAIPLLLVIFVVGSAAGMLYQRTRRPYLLSLQIIGLILISSSAAFTMNIMPEINKRFWDFDERVMDFSRWNAISRIDVVSEKGDDQNKTILIDGDALSPMKKTNDPKAGPPDPSLHREVSYILSRDRPLNNALIIGAGGGSDVLMAYKHHARLIDAVEINPTTAEIVSKHFSFFIGDVFKSREVKLHVMDGRSFVRRSDKLYDIIMLYGVDSFAALSSGAYVMTESYLYTVEALADYWAHLAPEGIVQISRWHYPEAPRETLRAFITAYTALSGQGVDPSRHLLVIGDSAGTVPFADVLISRRPFLEKDIRILGDWLNERAPKRNWLGQFTRSQIIYNPLAADNRLIAVDAKKNPYYAFAEAFREKKAKEFFEQYQFNVRPVTDDSPFFFQYGRWSHIFKPYPLGPGRFESIQGKWPYLVILAITVQSILLVVLLVWLPILGWKRRTGSRTPMPVIFYFSLLGCAFMFVEMALMQKVVILLGHPVYSMALTIPTMLISAGAGSICSGRIQRGKSVVAVALAAAGICLLILIWIVAGPALMQALLPLSTIIKMIAVVVLIAPLAFLMGLLFPIGISELSGFPRMIPIAWAANGGMSVIGSIIAVIVAMTGGFTYVLAIAAASYLAAAFSFVLWRRDLNTNPDSLQNL